MTSLVCLTYDDALPVHREVASDLFRRGLRATFYVPAGRDDLHLRIQAWRQVAAMGHELGNHSCWHPCRTRPEWEWKPPYRLEEYSRERVRDELLLANRVLHLIDGRSERSYGATCSDLTCGPGEGESFLDHIRDLFTVVRSGQCANAQTGPWPFVVPSVPGDQQRADEIIAFMEAMRDLPDAWMVVGLHGIGTGTHSSFIDAEAHHRLIEWIAAQRAWLEAVTVLQAAHRLRPQGDEPRR